MMFSHLLYFLAVISCGLQGNHQYQRQEGEKGGRVPSRYIVDTDVVNHKFILRTLFAQRVSHKLIFQSGTRGGRLTDAAHVTRECTYSAAHRGFPIALKH